MLSFEARTWEFEMLRRVIIGARIFSHAKSKSITLSHNVFFCRKAALTACLSSDECLSNNSAHVQCTHRFTCWRIEFLFKYFNAHLTAPMQYYCHRSWPQWITNVYLLWYEHRVCDICFTETPAVSGSFELTTELNKVRRLQVDIKDQIAKLLIFNHEYVKSFEISNKLGYQSEFVYKDIWEYFQEQFFKEEIKYYN